MKRLLALFATLALLVSMFSGVAFANGYPFEWELEIDDDVVIYNEGFYPATITGRAVDADSGAVRDVDEDLYLYRDDGNGYLTSMDEMIMDGIAGMEIIDGFYSVSVVPGTLGVGTYILSTVYYSPAPAQEPLVTDQHEVVFRIVYDMQLVEPTELYWVYPDIPDTVIVHGLFTNGDNEFINEDLVLAYQGENGEPHEIIAWADFANEDVFGFLFSGDQLFMTGDVGLYVYTGLPYTYLGQELGAEQSMMGYTLLLEGEVVPGEMDVTVDPPEAMVNLGDVKFTAEFDISSDFTFDDQGTERIDYMQGYELWLEIDGDDGDAPWYFDLTYLFADQQVEGWLPLNGIDTGTYEFTFTLEKYWGISSEGLEPEYGGSFIVEEGMVEVEAIEPDDYNLVGWNDDPLKVGDNEFAFCMDMPPFIRPIVVRDQDGFGCSFYYEVIFNGAGLEDETFEGNRFDWPFTVSPLETGLVEVTINVYEDDMYNQSLGAEQMGPYVDIDNEDPVHTFTRELEVDGWNVTITPDVVEVDSEVDITVTITDENGDPVNNAIITSDLNDLGFITIPGEVLFDAGTTNVVGGVYVIEYDDDKMAFDRVGFEDMQFWTEEQFENTWRVFEWDPECFDWTDFPSEVNIREAIEVVGHDIYNVTTDTPVLLEGFEEEIIVTPLDEDGEVIYPLMTVTYYDDEGDEIYEDDFTGDRVDTDDDGVKESIEGYVYPAAGAVRAVVRASSSDLKEYGEAEMEVVKPQIIMTKAMNLTAYIETDFEFTVIDPRDGSMMDAPVLFIPHEDNYFTCGHWDEQSYGPAEPPYMGLSRLMDPNDDYDNLWYEPIDEDDGVYSVTALTGASIHFEDAEDDENDVNVVLAIEGTFYRPGDHYEPDDQMGGVLIELTDVLVLEPTAVADPPEVIIGTSANIVMTYTDADGNPLEGYDVDYDPGDASDIDVGETDENGQVSYATIAVATGDMEFEFETDLEECQEIELFVPVTVDLEPPTAVLTDESNGVGTITIMDNVRVQKAMVNGVLVDMFYPAPTVVHLAEKADLYHVQAIDQNYNYLMITLEGAQSIYLTVIIGQDCGGFGPAELLGDTTMVPVRYAQELGATVTWDEDAETVVYSIDNGAIVIEVQIGDKTAMVNGVPVEMPEAPYISEGGRTMVPIRMISEEFGFTVDWVGNGTSYIY